MPWFSYMGLYGYLSLDKWWSRESDVFCCISRIFIVTPSVLGYILIGTFPILLQFQVVLSKSSSREEALHSQYGCSQKKKHRNNYTNILHPFETLSPQRKISTTKSVNSSMIRSNQRVVYRINKAETTCHKDSAINIRQAWKMFLLSFKLCLGLTIDLLYSSVAPNSHFSWCKLKKIILNWGDQVMRKTWCEIRQKCYRGNAHRKYEKGSHVGFEDMLWQTKIHLSWLQSWTV